MGNKRKHENSDNGIKDETVVKYNIQQNVDGDYYIPKQKVKKTKDKKQLKGEPLDNLNPTFIKKRNDIIRAANKKIDDRKEVNIKNDTMEFYGIKLNPATKLYEII